MRSKFTKYRFDYDSQDYPYNLKYRWMSRHKRPKSSSPFRQQSLSPSVYFIEMLTNYPSDQLQLQVQQLSPESCAKIDQAYIENKERVFIRNQELYGHYVNLHQMTLISTCNMARRRLYTLNTLPEGAIIYHPLTQTSMRVQDRPLRSVPQFPLTREVRVEEFSTQHKLRHMDQLVGSRLSELGQSQLEQNNYVQQFHWLEIVGNKYKPLKESISIAIEKNFNLYDGGLANAVSEITWQNERFVVDLREFTLLNTKTLEVFKLRRVNLDDVTNLKLLMTNRDHPNEYVDPRKDYVWQFEIANFRHRAIEWESYDIPTQKRLEKRYQEWIKLGFPSLKNNFTVKRGTQIYYIDYKKMVEMNPLFKTVVSIRRVALNESLI